MRPQPSHNADLLAECYEVVVRTILSRQHQVTGLLATNDEELNHAWVRDNVFSISSVWALSMAYRRRQEADMAVRTYLLEQATIRCMRGLLTAMMAQREKVERFKTSFSPSDALHAKYCVETGSPVVGDSEWGHLQIDATALFILTLSQMITSGLNIIHSLDEVDFVQNLVFYIECAYIIPDYGMWERGDKSNQNIVELNSSSVGMAKAALAAIKGLNLFGGKGGSASVIHVIPDEISKCSAVLETMLPRGSLSKETDAGILTITGYPGFAIKKEKLAEETLKFLLEKLSGKYGLKRFLRDGYKTPRENTNKLHYESWELRQFEKIECEWPMFLCYLSIDYIFSGRWEEAQRISAQIESLRVSYEGSESLVLPELYQVPGQSVSPEGAERVAGGRYPFMWTQSLFVINKLLLEGEIQPAELDPLNTRLKKIHESTVVQVVVLAEDLRVQTLLSKEGFEVQTTSEVCPYQVKPASVLSQLYTFLGRNEKLGMSGRRTLDVGIETTSRYYKVQDKMFVFTPQSVDRNLYYTDSDPALAISTLMFALNFLSNSWSELGRPTVTLVLTNDMIGEDDSIPEPVTDALKKIQAGYIYGTRVHTGNMKDFERTSSIVDLAFLGDIENGNPDVLQSQVSEFLESSGIEFQGVLDIKRNTPVKKKYSSTSTNIHMGSIRKSHSIRYSLEESKEMLQGLMNERFDKETVRDRESSSLTVPLITKIVPPMSSPRRTKNKEADCKQNIPSFPEIEELVDILKESKDLQEQGDVLQYLVVTCGLDYNTGNGSVRALVSQLYSRCCKVKCWSLVRHTSGLLSKKIPNLALSLTELLVRQKQVTVGLPPHHEVVISNPLSARELRDLIYKCHEGDISTAALTQEVLTYLAKFIRSEPDLFHGMIRVRVGLIIQVMTAELGRTLKIPSEEAAERLLNMSPYQTNNLLYHIMAREEYEIVCQDGLNCSIQSLEDINPASMSRKLSLYHLKILNNESFDSDYTSEEEEGHFFSDNNRLGMWRRRRLLDGCLNCVPTNFYHEMWLVVERCQGISVGEELLSNHVTHEMTAGEMKFHLRCETLLNAVKDPEFRSLVVETIMILIKVVTHDLIPFLDDVVRLESIVQEGNRIFLTEQRELGEGGGLGRAQECCLVGRTPCGPAGVCSHFYDSAPSGEFGTLCYLTKAFFRLYMDRLPTDGQCQVM